MGRPLKLRQRQPFSVVEVRSPKAYVARVRAFGSSFVRAARTGPTRTANALKLELTETALVENAETAAQVMRELQGKGVRFGLDDFGTGYSSLGYLQRFRFDTLKIDRSFIRSLDAAEGNPELVAAMLTLARALHMDVVAEGVEKRGQLDLLESLGCDYIQGFVYSPPIPAAGAAAMLGALPLPLSVAA